MSWSTREIWRLQLSLCLYRIKIFRNIFFSPNADEPEEPVRFLRLLNSRRNFAPSLQMGQQCHGEGRWSVLSGWLMAWNEKGIRYHTGIFVEYEGNQTPPGIFVECERNQTPPGIFVSQPDLSPWGTVALRMSPQIHYTAVPDWLVVICVDLSSSLIFKIVKDDRIKVISFALVLWEFEADHPSFHNKLQTMSLRTWTEKSTQSTWSRQKWSFDISASQTE